MLVQSTVLTARPSQHGSTSPMPEKQQEKQHADRGLSPVLKDKKAKLGKGLVFGQLPASEQQERASPPRSLSPLKEPPPTLGSGRGPLHVVVPSTTEAFQVARDLMALSVPPTLRDSSTGVGEGTCLKRKTCFGDARMDS